MKVLNENERAPGCVARESVKRSGVSARPFATLVCAALVLAASAVSAARAQSQTPRIAGEVEEKEKQPKQEKETQRTGAPARQQNSRRGEGAPRAASTIEVTIKTDMPESDIYLSRGKSDMQMLGKTDAEGKLTEIGRASCRERV